MIWIGTSGYNYPEWKGSFYPADLSQRRRCCRTTPRGFRRSRSTTRSTGCRPRSSSPAGPRRRRRRYKLTLKAPRRITHDSRLKNCGDLVQGFCAVAGHARRQARRAAVPAAAECEKGPAALRCVSRRAAAEASARRSSSAMRRGWTTRCSTGWRRRNLAVCVADSEKMSTPVRDHGRLRVFPAARRGLHARRHHSAGPRRSRETTPRAATCSCISNTKRKAKARSSRGS